MLSAEDMGRVALWSDIGIGHAFEIVTRVKGDKVYKFSARRDLGRSLEPLSLELLAVVLATVATQCHSTSSWES